MGLRAALLIGIVIAAVVQVLHTIVPPAAGYALSDVLIALASAYAAFFFRRKARHRWIVRRVRVALGIGAVACGFWSVSNVLLLVSVAGVPLAAVPGQLLSTMAALLVPVAIVLAGPRPEGLAMIRQVIDVAAVSGAIFVLAWELVLAGADGALIAAQQVVVMGVLVVAAAVALVTLSTAKAGLGATVQQVLAAAALLQAATLLGGIRNDVADDPWWSHGVGAGYVLCAWMMAVSSRLAVSRPGEEMVGRLVFGGWALLPYLPVVIAVVFAGYREARDGRLTVVLVWMLLASFSLVLIRQFLTLVTVGRLASELAEQKAALAHQAHHDGLTGLLNRAAFDALAVTALSGNDVCILLLDLDGFKPVNDTYGHAAGDEVLIAVARRLSAELRTGDLVSRIGGDEFAILLTDADQRGDEVAMRLLRRIAEPIPVPGGHVTVGGSIGLAQARPGVPVTLTALLKQADAAMYAAKAAGKGRVGRYEPHGPTAWLESA
ncbi:GGDEF domain-containing protein [Actinoplanes sp. NBRC 101535]|uniref:GGDEF domain-containing protein n=1 Tax=Actinoplanes sp. NBRC 101535 TaxID=3032196 RepID=UPI002556A124|nr:GGDEF domain-containing protein [Actinoplanes sp. NBRC 101535]